MKKALSSLLCLILSISLLAQDPGYTGPAKMPLKNFWSHIEKLKAGTGISSTVNNAERMLQQVKEKDPSYNTTAMEAELKTWKDKATKEAGDKNAAKAKEEAERNYFKTLYQKMVGVYSSGRDIQPGVTGKVYYDRVIELNLAEYKEKRSAAGTVDPKSYPALTDAVLADYNEYLKRSDRLKWNVVQALTKSENTPIHRKK